VLLLLESSMIHIESLILLMVRRQMLFLLRLLLPLLVLLLLLVPNILFLRSLSGLSWEEGGYKLLPLEQIRSETSIFEAHLISNTSI